MKEQLNQTSLSKTYSLLNPAVLTNPHAVYAALRNEDPVHFSEVFQFWMLTRYEDISEALRHPLLSADRTAVMHLQLKGLQLDFKILNDYLHFMDNAMFMKDGAAHTSMRRVANQGFTPRALERWEVIIQQVIDDLLDGLQGKKEIELVEEVFTPMPIIVIARILGVREEDREQFARWGRDFVNFFGGVYGNDVAKAAREANEAMASLKIYFKKEIAERQKNPGNDVISQLVAAYEKGAMNEETIISVCTLLITAGYFTTVEQLGIGLHLLLTHSDQLALLNAEPALITPAVEEILRYDSSVPVVHRVAREDLMIGDKLIRKGQVVANLLIAANRDPEVFDDPDRFDITRKPTRHLAFGFGGHFCLGAELARMEMEIGLATILRRFPNLKLSTEKPPVPKCESIMVRGFHELWVRV